MTESSHLGNAQEKADDVKRYLVSALIAGEGQCFDTLKDKPTVLGYCDTLDEARRLAVKSGHICEIVKSKLTMGSIDQEGGAPVELRFSDGRWWVVAFHPRRDATQVDLEALLEFCLKKANEEHEQGASVQEGTKLTVGPIGKESDPDLLVELWFSDGRWWVVAIPEGDHNSTWVDLEALREFCVKNGVWEKEHRMNGHRHQRQLNGLEVQSMGSRARPSQSEEHRMTKQVTFLDVHYPPLSATRKRDSNIARRLGLRDYRLLAPGVLRFTYRDRLQALQAKKLVCRKFHDVTAGLVL